VLLIERHGEGVYEKKDNLCNYDIINNTSDMF